MSKRKKSRISLYILMAIFIYLAYLAVGQQKLIYAKSLENSRLESKIAEEKKTNEELKKEKKIINSDEYVEKVARDKLGMLKKNERIYYDIGK